MRSVLMLTLLAAIMLGSMCVMTDAAVKNEKVRHVVVFKFKPTATEAQIKEVTDAFRQLKDKIPGILAFEHGVNNSPEKKNLGFTHVYQLTFKDAAARDAYLPHPEHKKFGALLGRLGVLEDVFVVDYAPQD
ncbi:MAG TPA: Dabb family protein [Blastocatellia bacterium]|nr:Dabb family protein [Blastocatellia bacterium]